MRAQVIGLAIIIAGLLMACGPSDHSGTEGTNLLAMLQHLPTKEALVALGTEGSRSLSRSASEASGLANSDLSYEMDAIYSLLNQDDLCKSAVGSLDTDMLDGETLTVDQIVFGGVILNNIVIKYRSAGESRYIDLKYMIDQYSERFVTIGNLLKLARIIDFEMLTC